MYYHLLTVWHGYGFSTVMILKWSGIDHSIRYLFSTPIGKVYFNGTKFASSLFLSINGRYIKKKKKKKRGRLEFCNEFVNVRHRVAMDVKFASGSF